MPTVDRKARPRRRLQTQHGGTINSDAEWQAVIKETAGDEKAWNRVRSQVARYLLAKGSWIKTPQDALEIADAYHRGPHWLPALPPIQGMKLTDD